MAPTSATIRRLSQGLALSLPLGSVGAQEQCSGIGMRSQEWNFLSARD